MTQRCPDATRWHDFVDAETPDGPLAEHAATCATCGHIVAGLRFVTGFVRVPAAETDALERGRELLRRARLAIPSAPDVVTSPRPFWMRPAPWLVAVGAAAAWLLALTDPSLAPLPEAIDSEPAPSAVVGEIGRTPAAAPSRWQTTAEVLREIEPNLGDRSGSDGYASFLRPRSGDALGPSELRALFEAEDAPIADRLRAARALAVARSPSEVLVPLARLLRGPAELSSELQVHALGTIALDAGGLRRHLAYLRSRTQLDPRLQAIALLASGREANAPLIAELLDASALEGPARIEVLARCSGRASTVLLVSEALARDPSQALLDELARRTEARELLRRCLTGPEAEETVRVWRILAHLGDAEAASELASLAVRSDLRSPALSCLADLASRGADDALEFLVQELPSITPEEDPAEHREIQSFAELFRRLDGPHIGRLVALAARDRRGTPTSRRALLGLALSGSSAARDPLAAALRSDRMRAVTVGIVALWPHPDAAALLAETLSAGDSLAREIALRELARRGEDTLLAHVSISTLSSADRRRLVRVLGAPSVPPAPEILRQLSTFPHLRPRLARIAADWTTSP